MGSTIPAISYISYNQESEIVIRIVLFSTQQWRRNENLGNAQRYLNIIVISGIR